MILTGANSGIGFAASKILTSTELYEIVFACRSQEKAEKAINSLPKENQKFARFEYLDLNNLQNIREFADRWEGRTIDVLALNAGIQVGNSQKEALRSQQGYEQTIATNHIGHFLLVNRLLSSVNKDSGRIVFTASGGKSQNTIIQMLLHYSLIVHNPDEAGGNVGSKAFLGDLSGLKEGFRDPISMIHDVSAAFDPDKAYKDSKLCNVMTTLALSRRLKQTQSKITVNCFNPGLVPTTGLFRNFNPVFTTLFTLATKYVFKVGIGEEEAGQRLAYMISSPDLDGVSGQYYSGRPGKSEYFQVQPSSEAQNIEKQELLWQYTENLIKA